MQNLSKFFAAGQDSPPLYRVFPKGLVEGLRQLRQSIPGGGKKQD